MIESAATVIEQFCFASFVGQDCVVTLQDDETNQRETFIVCQGLPLTMLRALCILIGRVNNSDNTLGLPEDEDDGIARIWGRVKLPDSIRTKLENCFTENDVMQIAVTAFHARLIHFSRLDLEPTSENASKILADALDNIEQGCEDSQNMPIRVTGLSEMLKPMREPPWWNAKIYADRRDAKRRAAYAAVFTY